MAAIHEARSTQRQRERFEGSGAGLMVMGPVKNCIAPVIHRAASF